MEFAGGFLAGGVVAPALLAVLVFLLVLLSNGMRRPDPRLELAVAGRDVSQAGGVAVEVQGGNEVVRQACRGACDDLRFAGATANGVRIVGSSGACLVCKTLSRRRLGSSQPWAVGGQPHLSVERRKGA